MARCKSLPVYSPECEGDLIAITAQSLQACLKRLDDPAILARAQRLVDSLQLDLLTLEIHLQELQQKAAA